MKKCILMLCMSLSALMVHAQDSTSGARFLGTKWENGSVGVMVGSYRETPFQQGHLPDRGINLIKPNQTITPFNITNLNTNRNNYVSGTFFNPYISFHPWSKKNKEFNKRQELRLGILYYGNSGIESHYDNTYNPGGTIDTTLVSKVSFRNNREDLGANIGYTGTSDVFWRRFFLYTGVDLGVTYSVVHTVTQSITTTTYDSVQTYYPYSNFNNTLSETTQYAELKGFPSVSVRGNALFGLNLRIVKPVTLFTEARLGCSYFQPIKGVGSINRLGSINIGFKFAI